MFFKVERRRGCENLHGWYVASVSGRGESTVEYGFLKKTRARKRNTRSRRWAEQETRRHTQTKRPWQKKKKEKRGKVAHTISDWARLCRNPPIRSTRQDHTLTRSLSLSPQSWYIFLSLSSWSSLCTPTIYMPLLSQFPFPSELLGLLPLLWLMVSLCVFFFYIFTLYSVCFCFRLFFPSLCDFASVLLVWNDDTLRRSLSS